MRPVDGGSGRQPSQFVSTSGPLPLRQLAAETWQRRDIIVTFARRDLQARYKQTVLGVAWAIVQPLIGMIVFVVFFGNVAGFDETTRSYAAFALSSLVGWQLVSSILGTGALAIVNEEALIHKVYFPRLAPLLSRVLSSVPNLLIGVATLLVLTPVVDGRFSVQLLLLPIPAIGLALAAVAVATPIAALSVYLRDFRLLVPFLLQIWLFASPVAYPLTAFSSNQKLYAALNPAVGPLDALRRIYVDATAPDFTLLGLSAASATVILLVGIEVYRRLEPGFADVI